MNKTKPTKRLFFQFSHLLKRPRLSADEIALAFVRAGLIEPVAFGEDRAMTHYSETPQLRALSPDLFRAAAQRALVIYAKKHSEWPVTATYVQLNNVRLHKDLSWSAEVRAGDLALKERKDLSLRGYETECAVLVLGETTVTAADTFQEYTSAEGLSIRTDDVTLLSGDAALKITALRFDVSALERELETQYSMFKKE